MPDPSTHDRRVRVFEGASALLGLWLIVSPFVVGAPGPSVARSGMLVGALILVLAAVRLLYKHTAAMSWGIVLLGAWTIMSPWVLGQSTGDFRTWNYILVGVIVAGLEAYSLTSSTTQENWRQRETGPR
jgi:SPW repeat-containing protein